MLSTEILGLIAGALTTGGFVPQVIRVYHIRQAFEISLPFTLMFVVGTLAWLTYGVFIGSFWLILWNALSAIFAGMLLFAKLVWGSRRPPAGRPA